MRHRIRLEKEAKHLEVAADRNNNRVDLEKRGDAGEDT
jgi:hypothetical protein